MPAIFALLTDLSKKFDTLNDELLKNKLDAYRFEKITLKYQQLSESGE